MTFNQQNQIVHGNQTNIGGDAVVTTLENSLNSVQSEIAQQVQMAQLDERIAAEVNARVNEALKQLQQPAPAKKQALEHLEGAKKLLDGLASASGLVSALVKAADVVRNLLL